MSYVTIAQIMSKRGQPEEFYANIEKALKKHGGQVQPVGL